MITLKQHRSVIQWLILGFLFLLPWQTRYIWQPGLLAGQHWEYITYSLYATELLLWGIILLFFALLLRDRQNWYALVVALTTPGSKKRVAIVAATASLFAVALLHSPHHFLSYYYVFHALEAACLFFCISQITFSGKQLQTAFWLGGVGQGILAIIQFATQQVVANKWLGLAAHSAGRIGDFVVETNTERWLRAYGSFGSPNMLGGYLALVFVLGMLLLNSVIPVKTGIQDTQRRILDSRLRGNDRLFIMLGQIVVLAGLVLSFSRSAWLAALIGIATLVFVTIREHKTIKFILFQSTLYLFLIAGLVYVFQPLFLPRLEVSGRVESRSINERTAQYAEAKRLFFSHTWLGVGPGEYTLALHDSLGSPASLSKVQPVHNAFLLVLVEFGILLFAVVLCIGILMIRAVWLSNPSGIALVATLLVSASLDHFWWTLYTGVSMGWIIFGIGYKKIIQKP